MGPPESATRHRENQAAGAADSASAAAAALSAQRLRAAFSSAAGDPAVLQQELPEGGAEMVAVEGAAEDTGRPPAASRNATAKASATGSGSKAGNQQSQRQLTRPRG